VLEDIVNVCCWPEDGKLIEFVDTVKIGVIPACVTLIVCAVSSEALTEMEAVRGFNPVFAEDVTVTAPLFEPDDGETVSHVGELLLIVQLVLDVIVKACCPPSATKFIVDVDTDKFGFAAACSIVTCRDKVSAVIVRMAFRDESSGLARTDTVISLFPLPETGWTVHQDWLEVIVQAALEVMVNGFCSAEALKLSDVVETDRF
jgi:hypothetical protein